MLGDARGTLPPAPPASSLHPGHFRLSTAGNAARVLVGAFAAPGVEVSTQEETGANSLERLGVGLAWLSRDECWSQPVRAQHGEVSLGLVACLQQRSQQPHEPSRSPSSHPGTASYPWVRGLQADAAVGLMATLGLLWPCGHSGCPLATRSPNSCVSLMSDPT